MTAISRHSAALQVATVLGEAIRDLTAASPLGGVPSGELYARVMSYLTLEQYQAAIDVLKRAGLVAERNHLLAWIGEQS